MEKVLEAAEEEIDSIENIGPAVVESILSYRKTVFAKHLVQKLFDSGVSPVPLEIKKGGAFEGKVFVLTGTLPTLSREDAKKLIQAHAGKVASSVSSKTDYVLAGENPGNKITEAEKLGIKILTEEEFLKMVK